MPADGGDPVEVLNGAFRNIYATGGWVYYIEDHEIGGLWRVSVDGGDPQPVFTSNPAKFYAIEDDLLYLLIDGGDSVDVIRMNLDGSNAKEVFSLKEKIHAISVSNHRLIIVKDSDSGKGYMALILDPDKFTVENKIDGMLYPALYCIGSDVYYVTAEAFVRQNLDDGEVRGIAF
jgi:hypothetical protein